MLKSRKRLKQELADANADALYYRNKISMIEYNVRKAKEKNTNIYTLYRDLREILYSIGDDKHEFTNKK